MARMKEMKATVSITAQPQLPQAMSYIRRQGDCMTIRIRVTLRLWTQNPVAVHMSDTAGSRDTGPSHVRTEESIERAIMR